MAGRIFNIFWRGTNRNSVKNQTLVACQKTFSSGIEEVNTEQQNIRQIYETVVNFLRSNEIHLQTTEEIVGKIYEEMASIEGVAVRLKQQIERDEKYLEEKKKYVANIQREVLQLRANLENMKDEYGFNEWVEKNYENNSLLMNYQAERVNIERETYTIQQKMNQLYDSQEEADDEIDKLQKLRDKYIEVHNDDMKMFTSKLNTVREKRQLFAAQPIEKAREVVFLFTYKLTELERTREELIQIKTLKAIRECQILSQKEEEEYLSDRNAELLFRVINDKDEINRIKGEKEVGI